LDLSCVPVASLRRRGGTMSLAVPYFTHSPTLVYQTYGTGALTVLDFQGFGRTSTLTLIPR